MSGVITRAISLALALTAVAGTAGCGSHHTGTRKAAAAKTATAAPNLRGKILFRRFLDDAHSHGALYVMNANGTQVRQVTHPPAPAVDSLNGPPSVTPDATAVVFDRSTPNAAGIFRMRIDGDREQEIPAPVGVPGDGWPTLSPDGTRIAVARAWGQQDEFADLKTGLYILAVNGARWRRVADFGYRADVGGASWSPDGKTIVFSVRNNGPGKPVEGSALFSVGADGRNLRRLTPWETEQQISGPVVSPDGTKILIRLKPSGQDFGGDYWTVGRDGGSRRRLTHFGPGHLTASAAWSPDGSMIVFADSGKGGNDDLYVMRADGRGVTRITHTPQWESAAVWFRS